ncbi:MAG: hypothetical protein M1834_003293 [Cirrosporium novae-zelandiae]|nr:MAG: hypothetical protein M1834_003293 [Cirrosporium novae-zelandiae]
MASTPTQSMTKNLSKSSRQPRDFYPSYANLALAVALSRGSPLIEPLSIPRSYSTTPQGLSNERSEVTDQSHLIPSPPSSKEKLSSLQSRSASWGERASEAPSVVIRQQETITKESVQETSSPSSKSSNSRRKGVVYQAMMAALPLALDTNLSFRERMGNSGTQTAVAQTATTHTAPPHTAPPHTAPPHTAPPQTPMNFSRKITPATPASGRKAHKDLPPINTKMEDPSSATWTPPPTMQPNLIDTHNVPGMTATANAFIGLRSHYLSLNTAFVEARDDNEKLRDDLKAKIDEAKSVRAGFYKLLTKYNRLTRRANQVLDLAHELKDQVIADRDRHQEHLPSEFQERYRLCADFDDTLGLDDDEIGFADGGENLDDSYVFASSGVGNLNMNGVNHLSD